MKDYLIALSSLIVVVLTALFALLTNRQKFREDLQAKYDASIHSQRSAAYLTLWQKLEVLAKFAPPESVTPKRLGQLSRDLREWFFQGGGLYLSDESREGYLQIQSWIKRELARASPADEELDPKRLTEILNLSSKLRACLSTDLGSRKHAKFVIRRPA